MRTHYEVIAEQFLELSEEYHEKFHAYWDYRKTEDLCKLAVIRTKIVALHKVLVDLVNAEYGKSESATILYINLSVSIQPFNYCYLLHKNYTKKIYQLIIQDKYQFVQDVEELLVESKKYPLKSRYNVHDLISQKYKQLVDGGVTLETGAL